MKNKEKNFGDIKRKIDLKRNPKGAGRKPSGIETEHTTIRVEVSLKKIAKKHNQNFTKNINEGLKLLYKKNKWM